VGTTTKVTGGKALAASWCLFFWREKGWLFVVPGGGFKEPCCGAGSSQRAGFHLNFEPEGRSQRLSHGLGWKKTPAKAIDTAGHLGPPLVTDMDHAFLTSFVVVPRWITD